MHKRYWFIVLALAALTVLTSACGGAPASTQTTSSGGAPASVTIAYQPSLGATALVVLKYQKTLEKQFPNTRVQWKILQSGAAVREAVIANQAQIGFMGLPPFLVGWDRGVQWKALTTLTRTDNWLVAKDPRIKSLKDITPNDKIAVVAPDALQAIILRKAAQQQLGDAHALDKNLVAMPPADAMQALLTGQIAANYAYPPFEYQEVAAGAHAVVKSFDVMGKVSSEVVTLPQSFYDQNPEFVKKLYQDIQDATAFAANNHAQTGQYLSQDQGSKVTPDQFKSWLDESGTEFSTTPNGLLEYTTFMKEIGMLSKSPASEKELEFPILQNAGS